MSKLIFLDSLKDVDYEKLGLKCGLEIHQQLNCGKLFSPVGCNIVPNETLDKKIVRKLRFSLSETGEVDKAALNEFRKQKELEYIYNDEVASLVDLDEEPPKGPNVKAFDTAVSVGSMLNLDFFDKIQFMRKLIIDGSVTSGFQRTAMLGSGGKLSSSQGIVEIEGINIEEDSCRNVGRTLTKNVFALDRQGIPLIEITTGPQIYSPKQAQDIAKQIGDILRSFKETKRGLGTIRQDLNVSIVGGSRVEIKGAQNLKLIPEVVGAEAKRQLIHKSIIEHLGENGFCADNFTDWEVYDVSDIFKNTSSEVINSNIKENNSGVMAVKLFGFKGILGHELQENFRFATEVSNRNKEHFSSIKGLFHTDELPKYGITQEEVDKINLKLGLKEKDAFILIAQEKDLAIKSLQNVLTIIADLIIEVPSEVRQVDPKGIVTKFLRPMPGAARMYPETDVSEIEIRKDYLEDISANLPELFSEKIDRLKKEFDLSEQEIITTLDRFSESELARLIEVSNKSAKVLYSQIFDIPKDIKKRDNVEPIDLKFDLLVDLFETAQSQDYTNSVLRDIFLSLFKDGLDNVESIRDYVEKKQLIGVEIDDTELKNTIKKIIEENKGAPFGALMGKSMQAFDGKVDGKKISSLLKELM